MRRSGLFPRKPEYVRRTIIPRAITYLHCTTGITHRFGAAVIAEDFAHLRLLCSRHGMQCQNRVCKWQNTARAWKVSNCQVPMPPPLCGNIAAIIKPAAKPAKYCHGKWIKVNWPPACVQKYQTRRRRRQKTAPAFVWIKVNSPPACVHAVDTFQCRKKRYCQKSYNPSARLANPKSAQTKQISTKKITAPYIPATKTAQQPPTPPTPKVPPAHG